MIKVDRHSKKKLISEAAAKVFVKNGFDGTSIRMIAREANISLGLMYNYFKSKDELLHYLLSTGMEQVRASFNSGSLQLPAGQMLPEILRSTFESVKSNRQFWKLYFSLRMQPAILQRFNFESTGWTEFMQDQLTSYFRAGKVQDAEESALALTAAIDGIAQHYVLAPSRFPLNTAINILIRGFKFEVVSHKS